MNEYFEANRNIWNQRTAVHKDSSFYNLEAFRNGSSVLNSIELSEVGDVQGKSLLHLQCHFGMDSLDWARRGAQVTGVDLSDAAIDEAKQLNNELGLDAKFVCSNVYDIADKLEDKFDIVFNSYGVVGWLPDLDKWAKIVAETIKPGGFFYLAEFHPVVWMFDDDFTHIKYSYEKSDVIVVENEGTYTDRKASISGKEYSWNHSIGEVINSLIKAGLAIEFFNEYMYSPYPCFRNTIESEVGSSRVDLQACKLEYSIVSPK